jgi:hypothetical protein
MGIYQVEGDDGHVYEVEGDDGPPSSSVPSTFQSKLEDVSQGIQKGLKTINMGSGYSGPVNDMDAESPISTITNIFNKGGELLSNKFKNPYVGAAMGMGASTLANPLTTMTAPETTLANDIPIPGTATAQDVAQNMGRRALGVNKGMIKKMPGGIDTANQKVQTLLDQTNVIGGLRGASGNLDAAENALDNSGRVIGTILKRSGQNAFNTQDIANKVIDELAPAYPAIGAYGKQDSLANEIVDTIMAHGNGPIDFQSAQDLKNTLQGEAGANWQNAPLRAAAYQKAYGIVGDAMENGIQQAGKSGAIDPSLFGLYKQHKNIYGAAKMAVNGLRDKAAGEAANNILSLPGVAIGAGAMAHGNIPAAFEAVGGVELAKRYGAGAVSNVMNYLSKAGIPASAAIVGKILGQGIPQNAQ